MTDDFDDLPAPATNERMTRAIASLEEARRLTDVRRAGKGDTKIKIEEFLLPVSKRFLGQVLNMDPNTVTKRLRRCKPAGSVGSGREVYNFHEAIQYLVKPRMDLATYLKTLNPAEMPNSINKVFWEAERIKNKTLIETGQSWSDEKVLETLGTVFMLINNRLPLITEKMRERGLTDEQFKFLVEMCDQFRTDLHEALVELPKKQQTLSRRYDIDPHDGLPTVDDFEAD